MKAKEALVFALSAATVNVGICFISTASKRSRPAFSVHPSPCIQTTRRNLVPDWTTLTTAIEYFDGSQLVDSVVVSNVFWSSLATKLISLVVGQVIATIVFGLLLSLAARQMNNVGSFISDKVFGQEKAFRKLPDPATVRIVQPDYGKLLICILVDVIGSSSELIPILGEATDVVWAPIAGLILRSMYNSNILFGLEFVEEILPFTDVIPLATICWVVGTYFGDSSLAKLLNLGIYSSSERLPTNDSSIMDVPSTLVNKEQLESADPVERR